MDGILLDTERWERSAWRKVARRFGRSFPEALYANLIGRGEVDTHDILCRHFGRGFALEEFRTAVKAQLSEWLAINGVPRKTAVVELLDALDDAGIQKTIATSSVRASAMERLGELTERFPIAVFGDDVSEGKPDPEIFQVAAGLLHQPAHCCLAVEDSPAGVRAAERAGMTVIVIPDLLPPPVDARYVCKSLKDMVSWVERADSPAG